MSNKISLWTLRVGWKKVLCLFGCAFVLIVVGRLIALTGMGEKNKADLPKINIVLNQVNIDTINENDKNIIYGGNELYLETEGEMLRFDDVEIKGRGNASWGMNKKSYRIKFAKREDILGMGKMRKWVLIPNELDDSLLRNDLMRKIMSMISDDYNIFGEFVKLFVDGDDLGLYYLSKTITDDQNSVFLDDSFGIIVEMDNAYCYEEAEYYNTEIVGDCMTVKDVVNEDNKEVAMRGFLDKYAQLEEAVLSGDYEWFTEVADEESWAMYYLMNEFAANPDAYITSWFLYMNGNDDEIHTGVTWDFDAAFGNRNWSNLEEEFYMPNNTMARLKYVFGEKEEYEANGGNCRFIIDDSTEDARMISRTMCYLVDMPDFRELIEKLYREKLSDSRDAILEYVQNKADCIHEYAIGNNVRWGMGSFDDEVEYLVGWIEERFDYCDELYRRRNLGDRVRLM